ncbi:MAG: ketoacyl-ACP synthase III [Desulfobacterales bacterium]|uniref:Beta-ketoacyl-[acyl-carrier-protein] synthase III n=1 Tax=Candidatus Desulfaltia bathyphila TaxID=2841697 RepID=A0A8J6N895_9BACT|nr:ketoacyl-ACP synthase III [Candidatus Desulfaltia bathyphila]MBL7208071.1 ketoacyl-ACP synthase III [Desulfobacterales bacterium]
MRAIITGVGHFVPTRKLTNKDLEQMVDTNDEWIVSRTGIKERRILGKDKGTSYMAVRAAKKVLKQTNTAADELDLIIVATSTPDMLVPPTAAFVQSKLNAAKCWGFDINAACAGFVYALATASKFIETGKHKKVMVIGVDKMSSILDYEDRNTCLLFGDGGGAVLLEPSDEDDLGVEDFIFHIDGSGIKYLNMPAGGSLMPASHETVDKKKHYIYQAGKKIFKYAVTEMADISLKIMKKNKLKNKDVKLLIPHQANRRIIDAVSKKIGLSNDQVVINIEKYGNTTAGTIPIAMSEAYQKRMMSKGDWIIISTFGAGFTSGSLLLKWAIE